MSTCRWPNSRRSPRSTAACSIATSPEQRVLEGIRRGGASARLLHDLAYRSEQSPRPLLNLLGQPEPELRHVEQADLAVWIRRALRQPDAVRGVLAIFVRSAHASNPSGSFDSKCRK